MFSQCVLHQHFSLIFCYWKWNDNGSREREFVKNSNNLPCLLIWRKENLSENYTLLLTWKKKQYTKKNKTLSINSRRNEIETIKKNILSSQILKSWKMLNPKSKFQTQNYLFEGMFSSHWLLPFNKLCGRYYF